MKKPLAYQFKGVEHYYGTHKVLDIKELAIPRGSITGIAGPNGSGKTTLLKLMTFAETPSFGEILFNGNKENLFSPNVRFNISLLTQKPYLLKRTVFENTAYGLRIRKDEKNIRARVAEALSKVGLPFEEFAQRRWHQLSGGEAQRVALAARLALRPQVLLLDEPTASVDAESAALIRDASLAARKDRGTTLVIVSHDHQWLNEISDTTLHLFEGKAVKPGRNTMIPGPWTPQPDGLSCCDLGGGQRFFAPAPPYRDAVGLISDRDIKLDAPKKSREFTNRLEGIVTQLVLDTKNQTVITSIQVAGLTVTTRLDQKAVTASGLYPGRAVTLFARPDAVTWL
ncbi:MAG: ATP-binding cassette domain-containing protein [Desulfobacteraceae bacterium]|nr:ATP-binding cassette domain-containing protein [Desulfobacteraceae bacterium]